MKTKKIIFSILMLAVLVAGFFAYSFYFKKEDKLILPVSLPTTEEKVSTLENGQQCYTYNHEATKTEPYTVNEFINITVDDTKIIGTKTGTQKGPDMTNGYTGILVGTLNKDVIDAIFSYTIEGSKNQEKEIYKTREDKIGIEKLRYQLIEKDGMLVPDTTKEFKTLLYARVGCTPSDGNKVLETSKEVLKYLSARNYTKLEELVSVDGLSLSQTPNFDSKKNLIIKNDISEIPKDTKIYLWGYTDGEGAPINLTREKFLTTHIYNNSVDYSKAKEIAVNKKLGNGNSLNTIDENVAGRTYVAFHFPGFDKKYDGMDWTTLYLIFDTVNGEYKLRGIAKDNWTI